jgi:hypothetical protein
LLGLPRRDRIITVLLIATIILLTSSLSQPAWLSAGSALRQLKRPEQCER